MLLEIKVKDFAIIDSLHVSFGGGLNILSGETGAGKSVILKSLTLLMGQKTLSHIVKANAQRATVEGVFDLNQRTDILEKLDEMGIENIDNQLIVRRLISAQGKNRIYLNGHLSALTQLKNIVAPLIEVTGVPLIEMIGQHDSLHLQSRTYHLDTLDRYAGTWKLRQEMEELYSDIKRIDENIQHLMTSSHYRTQRLDFLTYQRDEINDLGLHPGEEEELETSVRRMKNSSRLLEYLKGLESSLYSSDDSVLTRLQNLLQRGRELKDPELESQLKALQQAQVLIEDSFYELRNYGKNLSMDPKTLNEYEHKLSQLRRLQKKYGKSVKEILESFEKIEQEISELENFDDKIQSLNREKEAFLQSGRQLSAELHKKRQRGATKLSQKVNEELMDLNMKGLTFNVNADTLDELQATGITQAEFVIKASKSDIWKPLAQVASGGELSRILLSLKRIIGNTQEPKTYLFDEVDTGVSGLTAEKVGRKLKSMAQGQQVICVTHLPQVAAFADHHYLIEKKNTKAGVQMKVSPLNKKDQVKEIARLVSGERITQTSLDHAQQLLEVQ